MAGVEENLAVWTRGWDWSEAGDDWSSWWGGTEAMWLSALLPRIQAFVPTGTILEIAPGYGRWTQYLKGLCDRLVVVDLTPNCIEHCRERFAGATNIEYHVNDGRSLAMVGDSTVDLAFSFDSLVHVEADVLGGYIDQLAQKLTPDGVAVIHHSNVGSYRLARALAHRVPPRFLRRMVDRGLVLDLFAWRAESVSADLVARRCERAGLACVSQELISWQHGAFLTDTITVMTRIESRWARPREVERNRRFRQEGARTARLYASNSFGVH